MTSFQSAPKPGFMEHSLQILVPFLSFSFALWAYLYEDGRVGVRLGAFEIRIGRLLDFMDRHVRYQSKLIHYTWWIPVIVQFLNKLYDKERHQGM